MYIRFVINETDSESSKKQGLFMAMGDLRDSNVMYDYEITQASDIYNWFKENLKVPYVQSSESSYYSKPQAISWFKDSATEHISKMREYAQIFEAHDVHVIQITTERPGKVVYEDEYQVAAIPFSDTFD